MIVVRPVRGDERAAWDSLWTAYLAFYGTVLPADLTNLTWKRLQNPEEPMHVIGAYVDGRLSGIVHYLFHRSTWTSGDYCYLQDLFVGESARDRGLGRRLIEAVADAARDAGASRVYWLTKEDNHVARALYDKVADQSGFIQYRRLLTR